MKRCVVAGKVRRARAAHQWHRRRSGRAVDDVPANDAFTCTITVP